jgi:hypothetical protein
MRIRARLPIQLLFLSSLMPLSGCGAGSFLNSLNTTPDLSGNWEIASQAGATTGTVPTAGLLLVGSLSSQGSNVTGIFRLANLSLPNNCGTPFQQVVTVTGSIDSSRNLTLASAAFSGSILSMKFVVPPTLATVGAGATLTGLTGTVAITGGSCTFASSTAFGAEIVSLTGTYAGPLTANPYLTNPPIPTGTATLTLTQSTTPQADGQFPIAGTLNFTGGGCTNSKPVSGTVSGTQITLTSAPTGLFNVANDNLAAILNLATGQIDVASLIYTLGPCNTGVTAISQYTGNLTRQ